MNIYAAAHYMKVGYRIRRVAWRDRSHNSWIDLYSIAGFYFHIEDFLESDWEVVLDNLIDNTVVDIKYHSDQSEEE